MAEHTYSPLEIIKMRAITGKFIAKDMGKSFDQMTKEYDFQILTENMLQTFMRSSSKA